MKRSSRGATLLRRYGIILFFAIVSFAIVSSGTSANTSVEKPLGAACDWEHGNGEAYYSFDRLVVYYASFPDENLQERPEYSERLRFAPFNEKLLAAIRANFAACLKTSEGEKPLITIVPQDMKAPGPQAKKSWLALLQHMADPRTLTISVALTYVPGGDVAVLSWHAHRHDLVMIPLYKAWYGVEILSPVNEVRISTQLGKLGESIKPATQPEVVYTHGNIEGATRLPGLKPPASMKRKE